MNRKINRRTRRMATQVIDFNPNDINDIKTLKTASAKACKTDQNQFNSQISKLLKQHETEGTENKEAVNCRSNNVIKEEQKHETKKQEQVNNKDLNDVNKSPKAISDGVLKLKEDKVVSERLCEDNANKRKDVIQLNINEKEKVKNNAISVDQIPLSTAIGVEHRQFVFKDLLNKFKKIENESLKSNIFEKKPCSEFRNLDPNENIEIERRPVNANQPITLITNEDSTFSLRRPVDIVERAFDFKKLISIFNK